MLVKIKANKILNGETVDVEWDSLAEAGGGGTPGAVTVFGPIPISHDTPGIGDTWVPLPGTELTPGQIVLASWIIVTQDWISDPTGTGHHYAAISNGEGTAWRRQYFENPLHAAADQEVSDSQFDTRAAPSNIYVVPEAGSQLYIEVYPEVGVFTQGSLDAYSVIVG